MDQFDNNATWYAALWLSNNAELYGAAQHFVKGYEDEGGNDDDLIPALADFIRDLIEQNAPYLGSSLYQDLLAQSIKEIDYYQVARDWLDR